MNSKNGCCAQKKSIKILTQNSKYVKIFNRFIYTLIFVPHLFPVVYDAFNPVLTQKIASRTRIAGPVRRYFILVVIANIFCGLAHARTEQPHPRLRGFTLP